MKRNGPRVPSRCLFVLLAALVAVPGLAAEEADASTATAERSVERQQPAAALAAALTDPAALDWLTAPAPKGYSGCCTADCDYGADVTCCGTWCSAHDDPNGYCTADGGPPEPCPPPPTVKAKCRISSCSGGSRPGERADYVLKCTGSGGTGSYSFSWFICNPISGSGSNPNFCRISTVGPVNPKCTVTSGGKTDSDTCNLSGLCEF